MKWPLYCALLLASAACEADGASPQELACSGEDAPTFANFGAAFLEAHCTRCHASDVTGPARMGAPPGYDFDLLETVQRFALDLDEQLREGLMPPDDDGPSDEEVARFHGWMACGAP